MKSFLSKKNEPIVPPPPIWTGAARPAAKRDNQFVNWCCTMWPSRYESNDHCYDVLSQLGELCKYACFGLETSDAGVEHLQGFMLLEKKMRLTELKKIDPISHFEHMKGTIQQNYDYCTKDDKAPIEFGEKPKFENNGERERSRWHDARQAAAERRWGDVDDQIYVSHLRNLKQIGAEQAQTGRVLEKTCGLWLYGVPHSGKSYDARNKYSLGGEPYIKEDLDKWFDNYDGQDTILLEDVDPDMCKQPAAAQKLKVWCDVYPHPVAVKGSMLNNIRPRRFIITSNFSIEECFPNLHGDALDALKRRFKIVHYPYPRVGSDPVSPRPPSPDIFVSPPIPLSRSQRVGVPRAKSPVPTGSQDVVDPPSRKKKKLRKYDSSSSDDSDVSQKEIVPLSDQELCECGDSQCDGECVESQDVEDEIIDLTGNESD